MKSTAHIKGHPLHPILIVFPVAFFTGTLVFDLLAFSNESATFWQVGRYMQLAGIVGAFTAAVPGIVDYIYTVPPQSSAKKRATKHGLLNSIVLVLFITAYILRDDESSMLIVSIEAVGTFLLMIAGWMGGTLVHRNQIGVNPRYANAGKWKEAYFKQSAGLVEVAEMDELKTDQMKLLHFEDKRIVLGRTEKGYVAFDDRCTHKGASLAGGTMICGTVQCPWHGSQFSVENGEVKAGPACNNIPVYKLELRNNKVFLQLSS